jgi:Mlc titration factor MtfA (ptsG expression regulator)
MVLPDGTVVHKIGMCNSNRSVDRMLEILRSWFMKFRFIPYTELRLDMECPDPQKLEKHIHEILAEKQFIPNHKVEGGTEMFVELNEQRVLHYLRAYAKSKYTDPPALTAEECKTICQLLTR